MKGIELEAGKRYRINGREYTVTKELGTPKTWHQYCVRRFVIQGNRGAVRTVAIRPNGSAWTFGEKRSQLEEVRSFQAL